MAPATLDQFVFNTSMKASCGIFTATDRLHPLLSLLLLLEKLSASA
jgi:hypothetical protein